MKFSAILATIVLAACATAIALPEPMAPVQHLDMEARSPTPVIKQTSRDEILQRNQLRATRTKERRDGSALPYPACDPNQPVTGTVWATFAGHDVSGNYLGMPSGVDTIAGCESSCQGYGGSCEGASLVDYGTGVACTLYYGVTGLYSVDGTTAGLPGSCSELASAGTIPSNCCNTYL